MFYQNFVKLCEEKGVSRGAVCQAVGLSDNAWRRWANGSTPNGKSLKAIADFFGVEPRSMLYETQDSDDGIQARRDALERPEMRILFDAAVDAPASAILEVALQLMKLKETNTD